MISREHLSTARPRTWSFVSLVAAGTVLNFVALFTDGNSALVAVGSSLIAIAAVTRKKAAAE